LFFRRRPKNQEAAHIWQEQLCEPINHVKFTQRVDGQSGGLAAELAGHCLEQIRDFRDEGERFARVHQNDIFPSLALIRRTRSILSTSRNPVLLQVSKLAFPGT